MLFYFPCPLIYILMADLCDCAVFITACTHSTFDVNSFISLKGFLLSYWFGNSYQPLYLFFPLNKSEKVVWILYRGDMLAIYHNFNNNKMVSFHDLPKWFGASLDYAGSYTIIVSHKKNGPLEFGYSLWRVNPIWCLLWHHIMCVVFCSTRWINIMLYPFALAFILRKLRQNLLEYSA